MAFDPIVPGIIQNTGIANFVTATGTTLKVLVDVSPAQMIAAISGESPAVSRPLQGGNRVIDATVSSTSANSNNMVVYEGLQATLVGGATGTVTPTSTTLTRTTGNYIADGFKVGDPIAIISANGATALEPNEGVVNVLTGVSATVLTASGAAWNTTALTTGTRIVKLAQNFVTSVAANSGNNGSTPNTPLIANSNDFGVDQLGLELGSSSMLLAGMSASISGAGVVSVRTKARGY